MLSVKHSQRSSHPEQGLPCSSSADRSLPPTLCTVLSATGLPLTLTGSPRTPQDWSALGALRAPQPQPDPQPSRCPGLRLPLLPARGAAATQKRKGQRCYLHFATLYWCLDAQQKGKQNKQKKRQSPKMYSPISHLILEKQGSTALRFPTLIVSLCSP